MYHDIRYCDTHSGAERDALARRVKALEAVVEATPVLDRLQDQIVGNFSESHDIEELEAFFTALGKFEELK